MGVPSLKPRPLQPSRDSSRWLLVTGLFWRVIKIPEAPPHCVQTREAIAESLASLNSISRTNRSGPLRTRTEWAITPGGGQKRYPSLWKSSFLFFVVFFLIILQNHNTLTLEDFWTTAHDVGWEKRISIFLYQNHQRHSPVERLTPITLPLSSCKRCSSRTKLWGNAELGMGLEGGRT